MSLSLNPFSVAYWMHGFAWREPKKSDEPLTLNALEFGNLLH